MDGTQRGKYTRNNDSQASELLQRPEMALTGGQLLKLMVLNTRQLMDGWKNLKDPRSIAAAREPGRLPSPWCSGWCHSLENKLIRYVKLRTKYVQKLISCHQLPPCTGNLMASFSLWRKCRRNHWTWTTTKIKRNEPPMFSMCKMQNEGFPGIFFLLDNWGWS